MPLMEWTQAMSVGVAQLDQDHQRLFDIINRLAENAEPGAAADEASQDQVRQCLYALMRYAESHFAREENVMKACGFPGLEHHLSEHVDFVARVQKLTERLEEQPRQQSKVVNEDLLQFLKDWLSHHILIEDMAYRPHAENHPEALKAAKNFKPTEVWWGGRAPA